MKVKKGDWIRTKYNGIEEVECLYQWFGVEDLECEATNGYVVDVSYKPQLLLRTGDLVQWGDRVVEVYVDEETQDLSSYLDKNYILRNNITKIWTTDDEGNYILQWSELDE